MARMMNRKKIWFAGIAIVLSQYVHANQLNISYDQMIYQELPYAVLAPFSVQGLVNISENNFSSNKSKLPDNIPDDWDIIAVGRDILEKECGENGLLETINYDKLPHKNLLTIDALQKCGLGSNIQAMTLNYAYIHKYGIPPTYWSDLLDFNRYPGKRALPKQARYLFETILLADGVQSEYVYDVLKTKEGQQRVLNKLDIIYDDIIWWEDLESLKEWLEEGYITMAVAPDGAMLTNGGIDSIGVSRHQVLYEMRYYGILKNSQKKNLAYAFISYATQPDQQLSLFNKQFYGPTIKQAWRLSDNDMVPFMTNNPKNLQNSILLDYQFYAEQGEVLDSIFNNWLNSKRTVIQTVNVEDMEVEQISTTLYLPEDESIEVLEIDESFRGPELPKFMGPILPVAVGPFIKE